MKSLSDILIANRGNAKLSSQLGLGFGSRVPLIITAIIRPALASLVAGDTIEDNLSADIDQTTNYTSTAGTITSVVVAVLVNGETPASLDIPLDFEDVVSVTVTVTDSEANVRVFSLGRTVAGIAPSNDVAPAIAGDTGLGDTLTATAGTWSGVPAPSLSYQWLRGGVEIAGETGTTYVITLADSGASITVRETATNSEGSAFEVSNAITADTFTAPDAFTAPDWDVANDGDTVSVNILVLPSDGGAPITDLEYRVNGGTAISLGETTTGSYPITAVEGDDIEIRAVNVIGAGDWSDVKAVPSAFDADALAYITAVETADDAALEAGVREAINDFVVGCKADGIWDALKASCILAGARTLNGCLVPLKGTAPTNFNFVSADYNRKTGLKGDGATKYLNSNRNNNADPQNDKHVAVFISQLLGTSGMYISAGNLFGLSGATEIFNDTATRVWSGVNSLGTPTVSFTASSGFVATSRAQASNYNTRIGGSTITVTQNSSAPRNENIFVFARSNSGPSAFTLSRLSFYSIGESLDLAALDTRVSALMTAIDGAIA
jgi:hypothetical protein